MSNNRERQIRRGLCNLAAALRKSAPSGTIANRLSAVLAHAIDWEIKQFGGDCGRCVERIRDGFGDWREWDVTGGFAIARALRQIYGDQSKRTRRTNT